MSKPSNFFQETGIVFDPEASKNVINWMIETGLIEIGDRRPDQRLGNLPLIPKRGIVVFMTTQNVNPASLIERDTPDSGIKPAVITSLNASRWIVGLTFGEGRGASPSVVSFRKSFVSFEENTELWQRVGGEQYRRVQMRIRRF